MSFATNLRAEARQRAPFFGVAPFPMFRYVSRLPLVMDAVSLLGGVASLWPGLAIVFCWWLGLNRRTCALLASAYLLEALLISICCPNEAAAARYQAVWVASDAALTAGVISAPIQWAWSRATGKARTAITA